MLPDSPHGELQRLLADLTEGLLGPEELAALTAILRTDPSPVRSTTSTWKCTRCCNGIMLRRFPGRHSIRAIAFQATVPVCAGEHEAVLLVQSSEMGWAPVELATASQQHNPLPGLSFLGNMAHGTVGYFSSGWPVAYLVATVILGLGCWSAPSCMYHRPGRLLEQSSTLKPSNPQSLIPNPSPKASFVGRITGMVDCQWADPTTAVPAPVAVSRWAASTPVLRPDGNHLRHGREGHPARALHV